MLNEEDSSIRQLPVNNQRYHSKPTLLSVRLIFHACRIFSMILIEEARFSNSRVYYQEEEAIAQVIEVSFRGRRCWEAPVGGGKSRGFERIISHPLRKAPVLICIWIRDWSVVTQNDRLVDRLKLVGQNRCYEVCLQSQVDFRGWVGLAAPFLSQSPAAQWGSACPTRILGGGGLTILMLGRIDHCRVS